MIKLNKKKYILCKAAHLAIFFIPNIVLSSINASLSSFEVKNGNRRLKNESKMTPTDQISIALKSFF